MRASNRTTTNLYATSVIRLCATLRVVMALFALSAGASHASAQAASDIFLLRVHQTNGKLVVDSVERVTNRNAYSNQPAFLRNNTLLFTTVAGPNAADQSDIWMYDGPLHGSHPFTKTDSTSEYSAYHMPGRDRISVIRVEQDSTQRLWSFDLHGNDPELVLKNLKPIGYQAWTGANHVAVFVLGDAKTRAPATLQLVDIRDESAIPIATGIGRALQSIPGRNAVSFTRRDSASVRWIDVYDIAAKTTTHAAKSLQNEYHVWLNDGTLVSGAGSTLYQTVPGRDADWIAITDLADRGIGNISRIAVSTDGRMIALVAAH
jgi:hypothetical protein